MRAETGMAPAAAVPRASARRHHFYNRVLFLCLLLLLAWAPLPLGSNRSWSLALLEIWVFALGALALVGWAVRPRLYAGAMWRERGVLGLLAAGLLYLGFQLLALPLPLLERIAPANASWWQNLPPVLAVDSGRLAASFEAACAEAVKQFAYVVFFCLTLVLVDSDRRLRLAIGVLIGTAVFEATYGLAAHFMRGSFPFWTPAWYGHDWASGTFINKNHYAANLSFGIALTMGLCLAFIARQPSRKQRLRLRTIVEHLTDMLLNPGQLRFGLLLVLFTAFFFAQSRGAFLGLAAAGGGLLVFGVYWWEYRGISPGPSTAPCAEKRLLPWLLVTAGIGAVWLSGSGLFARLAPSELQDAGRVVTWNRTFAMWQEHWLFGVGNGSFAHLFTRYKVAALDGHQYEFAHNDHLQLLAEQGLIGAILFYAFFGLCARRMLKAYCQRCSSRSEQGMLLGIMIAVMAFFLHGFVDFNFHIPANALWFHALMALGLVASARIIPGGRPAG